MYKIDGWGGGGSKIVLLDGPHDMFYFYFTVTQRIETYAVKWSNSQYVVKIGWLRNFLFKHLTLPHVIQIYVLILL